MNKIILPAPAKINLSLDITGILENGYHELEMIMQSISLHDIITVKKINNGINIHCSDNRIPEDESNLAYQAAKIVIDEYNLNRGVDIDIEKNIPLAAGLAGGSTDAAAVLKAVDKLYDLNISREKFYKMARKIGSDVSFCLYGGTALATGSGDDLKQLPDIDQTCILLVNPRIQISTPEVYKAYDQKKPDFNIPTSELVKILENEKDIDWSAGFANILEKVTGEEIEDIKTIKELLSDFNPELVLMTGSGPTVFAVVENCNKADRIIEKWPRQTDFITKSFTVGYEYNELDIGGFDDVR